MDNATYQDLPGISSHWLIEMLKSPAACWRKYLDPLRTDQKPSAAMRFGTLVHCLALTPLHFNEEFMIADGRRTQAGRAHPAERAATGKIMISPTDFERAQTLVAAIKAHTDARKLLTGGKREQIVIQERERGLLPLKARLDIHHPDQRLVVELKTIHSLNAMSQAINRYRYALSAAFYADITQAESVQFIFATCTPYEVKIFEMTPAMLADGREQWQTALARFDVCWLANDWPEAEPAALDDDPLMMDFMLPKAVARQRFELPVGKLAL